MKKMTSNQIRQLFLDYFKEREHLKIDSASLIPEDDPSLLWINAGVTPLKKYFDGSVRPKNKRLVSVQKCIRTNDIDNVGKTARHHTFFEMLGNFSIGDYFKKEAIKFACELLTSKSYFNLDPNKLYITIHPEDDEAYRYWRDNGVKEDHIIKLESNYWEIGEGPCGPDSEVFYDRGEKYDKKKIGIELLIKEIENDRYIEIWNNVFSQFNSKAGLLRSQYQELPSKNIDTGMGLERMALIMQGAETNYETDLFIPIIKKIEEISKKEYNGQMSFKVIADHIRALTFALGDGASFSNEGRGYVLRRLLRRAVRYGMKLELTKPFLDKLVSVVIDIMNEAYPELKNNIKQINKLINQEELLFHKTLKSGEKKLNELMENSNNSRITGEDAFKLYDTYGFPFSLTKEILTERGFDVSEEEFNHYMELQQSKARLAREKGGSMNLQSKDMLDFNELSDFVGYEVLKAKAKILALFKDGIRVEALKNDGYLVLDKTPFYAEAGGQASDEGEITKGNHKYLVAKAIKLPNGQHGHKVIINRGTLKLGDEVIAKVDQERRAQITKNHSAAHLLHEALKEALDESVKQAGSRIDAQTLRFDFTYKDKISDQDVILVETLVNDKIGTKADTIIKMTPLKEAKKLGAKALFEEKYEDIVRTVTLFDSFELCGGTHVKNTFDIKRFAIKTIESKGADVYRIEAATDKNIEKELFEVIKPYNDEMVKLLNKAKRIIAEAEKEDIKLFFDVKIDNSKPTSFRDLIFNRNEVLNVRLKVKELEKEYHELKKQKTLSDLSKFDDLIEKRKEGEIIVAKVEGYQVPILKQIVIRLSDKLKKGFVLLVNVSDNNVNFVAKSDKEISAKINCDYFIKKLAKATNGNGGGSDTFGQGGGTDSSKIDELLLSIKKEVLSLLKNN